MAHVLKQRWIPDRPGFSAYVARATDRPAARRADEIDKALAMHAPAFKAMFESEG